MISIKLRKLTNLHCKSDNRSQAVVYTTFQLNVAGADASLSDWHIAIDSNVMQPTAAKV
jgi:hypothetical protein